MVPRRLFLGAAAAASAPALSKDSISETLERGCKQRGIPCVAAMVADAQGVLYEGAFGTRDAQSGVRIQLDSIFAIASMTKAITTAAALQLVERKKVALDEPAERHLPELRGRQVLAGFHPSTGRPRLRPAKTPITLRHLLTHTSGLCYSLWDTTMKRWEARPSGPSPLIFDPGTRWQYGQGIDLAGRLVENVSGTSLEDYFQENILQPLGMTDTSFLVPAAKFDRLVTGYQRQADGTMTPAERKLPERPRSFNGGGGLFSTAPDYIRFMRMILNNGSGVLSPESIQLMRSNQTGKLRAGILKTTAPLASADMDLHPGHFDSFTLGFLRNNTAHEGGRAAGSLAWAGIHNTHFWIDPASGRCAVIMMQFKPFVDSLAVGLLKEFERAAYRA